MCETNDRFLKYFDILIVTIFFFFHIIYKFYIHFFAQTRIRTHSHVNIIHIIIDWISQMRSRLVSPKLKSKPTSNKKKMKNNKMSTNNHAIKQHHNA